MVTRTCLLLRSIAFALAAASPAAAQAAECSLLAPASPTPDVERPLQALDLARLRDFGASVVWSGERIFEISPDGHRVAFQLVRADPGSNRHCIGMFILPLSPGSVPLEVDAGGELLRRAYDLQGMIGVPSGVPLAVTPRWSPDGHAIAFLKRIGEGPVQIWIAQADGSGSAQATHEKFDVEDFAFTSDGGSIVYAGRPGIVEARAAIEREGSQGYHYDARYFPLNRSTPYPQGPFTRATYALDLATGTVRPATATEVASLAPLLPGAPDGARAAARSSRGRWAWMRRDVTGTPAQLFAEDTAGGTVRCAAAACTSVEPLVWWADRDRQVRFMRREGWAQSQTAIYAWNPGRNAPKRLFLTDNLLVDCRPLGDDLVCAEETSTHPRRLVHLNLETGRSTVLFDPNPEFTRLTLGRVERLRIKTSFDVETWVDLVYPVGYHPGTRYPAVVVQYDSRGFLRGGTGDEFPIQAFANRGYVVLSLQRPSSESFAPDERAGLEDFAERRNILSAIEAAVRVVVDRGIVDPRRIGITGLSDGSSTVQFAMLNSNLFAAAAASGCCWERAQDMLLGPAIAGNYAAIGWPRGNESRPEFWSTISLAQNASRIRVPLLIQAADTEYLGALESITALQSAGAPADLFVFPGEYHIKWQPMHKLAVYERALDWFDFWLRGSEIDTSDRAPDYARWRLMRDALCRRMTSDPAPYCR